MWQDIRRVYAGSWRFAATLPLLFLIPALPELIQHVAEFKLGMYASKAAFRAEAMSGARLGWGYVKTLALLLPGYWFVRYMAFDPSVAAARRIDTVAVRCWLAVFLFSAALQALALFAPPPHAWLGVTGTIGQLFDAAATLLATVLGLYLTAWSVAAALGNPRIGPIRSLAVMAGSFWRTVGYVLAGTMPLMAVHYALGLGAIGRADWLAVVMLAIDAVVVAFLALTMAGSGFVAAAHAARRKGDSLLPGHPHPVGATALQD